MKYGLRAAIIASSIAVMLGAIAPNAASADPHPVDSNGQSNTPTLPGEPDTSGADGEAFSSAVTDKNKLAADVGCWVIAEAPFTLVYNKAPIRAEGYISRCTPIKPDDCRTETDLEQNIDGIWTVVANGPVKWGCSVGSGSKSSTAYNCRQDLNGPHSYRTRTYLLTQYRGKWAPSPSVATSGTNSWWCE
ncbi:hypothetical protein ACBI99_31810 [Nonomuraea sp. ATR24]|uniref:hypothetical protein n=1 Tax=Nonomuraea sp. ATR24 TaxID=1676744 RepID=UPI0035BFF7AC